MDDTTILGWYWSETADDWQLARVAPADRALHTYVIGATGSGKTKFLESLIRQDLLAGRGVGVIDPHGDLIEDLKGFLASRAAELGERYLREQIVLVDLADPVQIVQFNPIEQLPGVSAGEQAAELIGAFRKIWASSWGVRMEDLLRNSLIALSEAGHALVSLPAFLTDREVRQTVLASLTHPIVRDYFQRYDRLSERAQLSWAEPVLNKINALLANDHVRALLAAPASTVNLRDVIDTGKVLLVKLDKGRLKDSADLLGSLLLAKLQLAVFARSDLPPAARRPFALYVDEFQNFATSTFGVFLSESRKYGLSLTLAHQTLAQIGEELVSLILGNVGLQVVFRVNRRDAERLAKEFFRYSGYQVKTVDLRRTQYWSLGEEWEHYTEELQQQAPRQAWIKHQLAGGLIPIQTLDVPSAWQELGLDPVTVQQALMRLPIGAAYLRPRIAAIPATPARLLSPAVSRANGTGTPALGTGGNSPVELTPGEDRFLKLVITTPDAPVSTLYRRFGASVWKGQQLAQELITRGYLISLETRLGRGGRRARYLVPTSRALDHCPSPAPSGGTGRGGPLHTQLQRFVIAEAEAKGYTTHREYDLGTGGIADVYLVRDDLRLVVEIAVRSTVERELTHIRQALAAGCDLVITLVVMPRLLDQLSAVIGEHLTPDERAKVRLVPVERLGTVF